LHALTRYASNLLEAYMILNATSHRVQCFLPSRHHRALAASEAGRTARADLLGGPRLASLRPMLPFGAVRSGSRVLIRCAQFRCVVRLQAAATGNGASLRRGWRSTSLRSRTLSSTWVSRLTCDMRGAWRPQAGRRPLDGRVRRRRIHVPLLLAKHDVRRRMGAIHMHWHWRCLGLSAGRRRALGREHSTATAFRRIVPALLSKARWLSSTCGKA
jgi:hypothetical protein